MKKIIFSVWMASISYGVFAQVDTVVKKVDTVAKKVVAYPKNYIPQLNVVYAKVGDWDGRMDVYFVPKSVEPLPLVISIHGGGWNHGTKESQTNFSNYFKMGFAVANVEYRLTPQAVAPAAIEDVRSALMYLVLHARELNIDVNRIVLTGVSAGGHLALLAGLLQKDHRFDTNGKTSDDFTIAAIIDHYGITDVWDWAYGPYIRSKSATNWMGAKATDSLFAASLSPVSYVKKTSPPTFIVHGDADPLVPYQESVILYKKFQDAGVVSQFITVPGGKHGGFDEANKKQINIAIEAFLRSLKIIN